MEYSKLNGHVRTSNHFSENLCNLEQEAIVGIWKSRMAQNGERRVTKMHTDSPYLTTTIKPVMSIVNHSRP